MKKNQEVEQIRILMKQRYWKQKIENPQKMKNPKNEEAKWKTK